MKPQKIQHAHAHDPRLNTVPRTSELVRGLGLL
jgi:hypothetical protein